MNVVFGNGFAVWFSSYFVI